MAAVDQTVETVEIPASVLVEACAAILSVEKILTEFNGGDETRTSERLNEAVHGLLDAAGARGIAWPMTQAHTDDSLTEDEINAMFRHPLVVESHARCMDLTGDSGTAERIRLFGDIRAQWDEWIQETLSKAKAVA